MQRKLRRGMESDSRGFTLIEVLISMAITIIVMSAVFGLLTRGQRSFQREPQVADLQQSARTVLDMVSKDALQAGGGLPPEFPSFTPKMIDPTVGDQGANPDVIEIVGTPQAAGEMYFEPEVVIDYDVGTNTVTVGVAPSTLQVGDLAVFYDDQELNADWIMAWVVAVAPDMGAQTTQITLNDSFDGITIPAAYSNTDEPLFPLVGVPLITRVSVTRYFTQFNGTDLVLMRQVDFGVPMPVGLVDDFQVEYVVGTLVTVEQVDPPHPHPVEGVVITPADVIGGVRITVAARSADENLEGSTQGASGDYIRRTFSTNINPRNILAGCQVRTGGLCSN